MKGRWALQACVAEVLSPKAGNVHPHADFGDVTWLDFVTSAIVTSPILERAAELGVGETVLQCVQATRRAVGTNTNLGIVLLLAPLCADDDVVLALSSLTSTDAQKVYETIRIAQPGGLGRVDAADIYESNANVDLIEAMRLAQDRDAIARQYVNNFADVLEKVVPDLIADGPLDETIVQAHLKQMAREPDSLIRRKCGDDVAIESQRRAQAVLNNELPFDAFDAWLREDDHRRNPGASADLITAGLYAVFAGGNVTVPAPWLVDLPVCS